MSKSTVSQTRQHFHAECEAGLNKLINIKLFANYTYLSMAWYFDRDDVSLHGLHKYFKKNAQEAQDDAEKIMKYQGMRGGTLVLQNIEKPERDSWGNPLEAMQAALELEKTVNQCQLNLHKVAGQHEDGQLYDWLEEHFLRDSVDKIKKVSDYVTNLKRAGPGLGEFMFDQEEFS